MRIKTILWIIACFLVLGAVGFLFSLRAYQVFTREELVAIVRVDPQPKGGRYDFLMWFTPVQNGVPLKISAFPIHGDQWTVGGEIVKWHPWVNLLGVKSCHRLTRISGRYLKADAELAKPRSVYELNGGTRSLWRWLYRFGARLPFVEAVYGNAAYTLAAPGSQWGVYVTLSGYLIKPLRLKS